jgi:hypothetical protein
MKILGASRLSWQNATRLIAGSMLLLAAGLKPSSPPESLTFEAAYGLPLASSAVLIAGEWLLGVLLLAGLWQRTTVGAAFSAFSAFAMFALYRGLSGAQWCGCFGAVSVSPWLTLTLDVGIAVALGRTWLQLRQEEAIVSGKLVAINWQRITMTIPCALVVVPLQVWTVRSRPTQLTIDTQAVKQGEIVLLEPLDWLGKPFPLAPYIRETSNEVLQGDWIVLLYHHDCPKCQEALPRYKSLAKQLQAIASTEQVMLVEVPPFGGPPHATGMSDTARLSDDHRWLVHAPVEIRLQDGKVVASSLDLSALANLAAPDAVATRLTSFER